MFGLVEYLTLRSDMEKEQDINSIKRIGRKKKKKRAILGIELGSLCVYPYDGIDSTGLSILDI